MIIRTMQLHESGLIRQIDRSETIGSIYKINDGVLEAVPAGHECPTWDERHAQEMMERFEYELKRGGTAYGAFDGDTLAGFGVLGHRFRGENQDRLQVDLMYVSRPYRRQGIGTRIMEELSKAAKERGASYLYISSTETESAVHFYMANGGKVTDQVDEELFQMEPEDIHMLKKL
ncbi:MULTISPECIES: GNAT family N-acetyltransferase [Paenibacillus]|uniref:GNAT family N-acetyltransferase n=1 Tax=Paenibacillus albilobatus TaxID=2716884 RepID=A0A919XFM0_9BACL|nr:MULTISPECIES: GNAT family N-acetyltransferase [Paenibacillus]MDR9854467.1 GNAT family N-acetyltransferase [Paenibacillus sp. VCA1]GIO30075.1 GNAT family N-acetyltransferase [Paenibacillus albilobatus]